jgi:integrase/recombinase XerD
MSPPKAATTTREMYDQALKYARDFRVPPGTPQPVYTSEWLPENVTALEKYHAWLSGGGTSDLVIRNFHLPMAGHVLGLNHKPSAALDPDQDFQIALDYILAKGHGPSWTKNCRLSLLKFRRFLMHERGQTESHITPYDPTPHTENLPTWLVEQLTRYQHVKQRNWREARIEEGIRRFWSSHLRVWRFLVERFGVQELNEVKRAYFSAFVDWRLEAGASVRSVNGDLRTFHGLMDFLQEQGLPVPHALLRLKCLKEPDPLPKFLTDEQVRALRDDFESRVEAAENSAHRRDALLDRAMFYLLWQAGLRKGEVEDLRQEDLDLEGRRLTVRRGKGMLDRTVFLTDTVVIALKAYLAVRGPGPTDHVFLFRNQAILKDLIHYRIKASGARTGVPVYAHRLRHTCATQLLNAGCRITSIQKFLGHKRLNTTLTYARAHDQTVEEDYFRAMSSVEKRLELLGQPEEKEESVSEDERGKILALTEKLAEPELSAEARLVIAAQIRLVLLGEAICLQTQPENNYGRKQQEHPPPSSVFFGAISV